jgi:vitamin B12 transporter
MGFLQNAGTDPAFCRNKPGRAPAKCGDRPLNGSGLCGRGVFQPGLAALWGRRLALCWALLAAVPAAPPFIAGQEPSGGGVSGFEENFDDFEDFGEATGITVTGAPETSSPQAVVTREEIERRQAPDLATLLEETLDIGITSRGAYGNESQINIRGFNTERIGILIDGVQANDPRTGEFNVSQIDLSNVERIEVIYGGSDSRYNVTGALGGVINIITKKKQERGWSFGGSLANTGYFTGSYNERQSGGQVGEAHWEDLVDTQALSIFAAYGGERFSARLSLFGDRAANHYLYKDYEGFARRKESNEVLDAGGALALGFDLPGDASLSSATDVYAASRHFPVTGTSVGYAQTSDSKVTERLQLAMPRFFHDALANDLSLVWTYADNRYGAVSSSSDHYLSATDRLEWYPHEKITLRTGLDWRFIHVDSTDDGVRDGNQGGAYLPADYSPWKPLTFTASVKGVTDTAVYALVPKAGLVWRIVDTEQTGVTLKNNYFRSFKLPDFDDLYYRSFDGLYAGNPALKPEDGLGADIAGELRFGERFTASLSAYGQWTQNAIHWVKHGSSWTKENAGSACLIGGDLRPEYTIPFSRGPFAGLTLGLSYQAQLNWLLNDDLDFADALRVPYIPTHIAGASADLRWAGGSLLVSAHWESLRYADTLNRMPLEPYCLLNLTLNQELGKSVTVFAVARNVLNWLYTSFAEYPMPGFTISSGLRVRLAPPHKK